MLERTDSSVVRLWVFYRLSTVSRGPPRRALSSFSSFPLGSVGIPLLSPRSLPVPPGVPGGPRWCLPPSEGEVQTVATGSRKRERRERVSTRTSSRGPFGHVSRPRRADVLPFLLRTLDPPCPSGRVCVRGLRVPLPTRKRV